MKKITIAIDGYSSCGKSTLAKDLAAALNYGYVDSGATYRAVTLYFIENQVDINDDEAIAKALDDITIEFKSIAGKNTTFLNGCNVEAEIRKMYVSEKVSPVATISVVRRAMVQQQQAMGAAKAIVMDGRDIGTVVFPDAELKIFLTADPIIRAQRRLDELIAKGEKVDLREIQLNLTERDRIDSSRADSPLRKADDAVLVDNTNLSKSEQMAMVLALVQERIKS
ncbi:MAG: (d)CMP kinase [Saprospiraceae bacterium]